MQNSRETYLLKDFYSRHRTVIDVLAEDDEMFRAVKEIAETEDADIENSQVMQSLDKKSHRIFKGGENASPR
jgi:spore coat polysaccharide biosynthesis protein SpsF (cytidylyltransferase family)